ncbi:NUDIX domain-containing protein [Candidatus Uhrbacteria bacterium]|nr:NUDIX domain-containing protein [Candidatus Uhrbacteria bacterium]
MKPLKEVTIAVALCERNESILLIQRKDNNPMWDKKWEFPGGKIETGESPEEAVKREVLEETGLNVLEASFFHLHHHDWDLPETILRVHLHCFQCQVGEGEITLEEEKAYRHAWATLEEALAYDSLSANLDILDFYITCKSIERG